jgi:sugar lactone lactonase YvrE
MLWAVRAVVLALGLAFAAPVSVRADAVAQGQEIAARGLAAAKAGDDAKAADLFREALALRPNHPGLTLRLATASARAGRKDAAVAALQIYAAMGLKLDLAATPDLASLAQDPRLDALRARFAENAKPKGAASIAATVAEPQLLGEGVAFEAATGRIFVAGVHKRKVIAVRNGVASDFVATGRDGLWGAFGVALDEAKGSLWVASSALPQAANIAPADKGRAGLFEFALADAKLRSKALVPADGKEHVFGDLIVEPSGDVFVSDSTSPVIYRLRRGSSALEEFARSDEFHSLQGLALSPDGAKLAVADYSSGIHVFDLASRARTLLAMPANTTLHGVDGLVRHGRDIIGVQNGIDPQRVILMRMNPAWSAIETVEVLAANLPEMDEPTLAAKAGDDLLVIGNGQWTRFADDGAIKGEEPFAPTRILRLALPPARP